MLKLTGVLIIIACSVYYGRILERGADKKLRLTEALLSLVGYIEASIKTSRLPLGEIFASFKSETLSELGFLDSLCKTGIEESLEILEGSISEQAMSAMSYLGKHLGGIDAEGQLRICAYTEDMLKKDVEILKTELVEKKRLYRLLPLLAGMSVIILIM